MVTDGSKILCTWNLYNVINQCCLNKNKKEHKGIPSNKQMRVEVSPCPFSSSFLPVLSAPPSTGSSILPLSNFIITSGNYAYRYMLYLLWKTLSRLRWMWLSCALSFTAKRDSLLCCRFYPCWCTWLYFIHFYCHWVFHCTYHSFLIHPTVMDIWVISTLELTKTVLLGKKKKKKNVKLTALEYIQLAGL